MGEQAGTFLRWVLSERSKVGLEVAKQKFLKFGGFLNMHMSPGQSFKQLVSVQDVESISIVVATINIAWLQQLHVKLVLKLSLPSYTKKVCFRGGNG